MDEKIKNSEVLLVKEKDNPKLNVVAGIDKNGKLKTVPPLKKHEQDFMKINKHNDALENFMSNFLRQTKDPTHFSFFKVPAENVDAEAHVLNEMLAEPQSNKAALDSVSVNAEHYAGKQAYEPLDEKRIDWAQFEKLGVSSETLQKTGALDSMLNYRKTPTLIPITAQLGDTTIRTEARLSLRETGDGRLVPVVHNVRSKPELDKPFYGVSFDAQDRANLMATGNLGRTADLTNRSTGEVTPSFVSVDKLTNELVAYRADRARIPNEVKGVQLNDEQKTSLQQGASVYIEGMVSKGGKNFNAALQYNADKRGLEFQFSAKQGQLEQQSAMQQGQNPAQRELRIPQTLKGREISPQEAQSLKSGQTVYMAGLKDGQGQEFNAYVRPNFEKGKFDFLKWNPDKSQTTEQTKQTQVAPSEQPQKARSIKM